MDLRGNSWSRDLHYGGNFPAKGLKDIEGTSLGKQTDWQVQNIDTHFYKEGQKKKYM